MMPRLLFELGVTAATRFVKPTFQWIGSLRTESGCCQFDSGNTGFTQTTLDTPLTA